MWPHLSKEHCRCKHPLVQRNWFAEHPFFWPHGWYSAGLLCLGTLAPCRQCTWHRSRLFHWFILRVFSEVSHFGWRLMRQGFRGHARFLSFTARSLSGICNSITGSAVNVPCNNKPCCSRWLFMGGYWWYCKLISEESSPSHHCHPSCSRVK